MRPDLRKGKRILLFDNNPDFGVSSFTSVPAGFRRPCLRYLTGGTVLIPRGARLIGSYDSMVARGPAAH